MAFIRVDKVVELSTKRARLSIIAESVKIGFRTAEKFTIADREIR